MHAYMARYISCIGIYLAIRMRVRLRVCGALCMVYLKAMHILCIFIQMLNLTICEFNLCVCMIAIVECYIGILKIIYLNVVRDYCVIYLDVC